MIKAYKNLIFFWILMVASQQSMTHHHACRGLYHDSRVKYRNSKKSLSSWWKEKSQIYSNHYQKIDKYKQKYRGNIFVDKFSRDFTDGNISSVYTEGITVGKKLKKK